jgi:hypothetical protein
MNTSLSVYLCLINFLILSSPLSIKEINCTHSETIRNVVKWYFDAHRICSGESEKQIKLGYGTSIYVNMHVCLYIYVCICVHIFVCIHTYTHTHTLICMDTIRFEKLNILWNFSYAKPFDSSSCSVTGMPIFIYTKWFCIFIMPQKYMPMEQANRMKTVLLHFYSHQHLLFFILFDLALS